jgi:Protein of unknown function, DUF547
MKNLLAAFLTLFAFTTIMASTKADHTKWNELLKAHVSSSGNVDYPGFKKDIRKFDEYLVELRENAPMKDWTKNERKAFYINAYNAYMIKFILTKYPIKSPKDAKFSGKTIWDFRMVQIGPTKYNLTQIENNILRKMGDPRIHFAINCGAKSCPKLLNEAYMPEKLSAQLTSATKKFLANKTHNVISPKKVKVSKIFEWYAEDFKGDNSLVKFLNKYSAVTVNSDAKVEYLEYNWLLNE